MDLGVLIKLVGLVVVAAGVRHTLPARRPGRGGISIAGTVVRQHEEWDAEENHWLYSPVIAFVDEHGTRREFTTENRTTWHLHPTGEKVPVVYPPGQPQAARLISARNRALELVPTAMCAVFALAGLLIAGSLVRDLMQG